MDEPQLGPGDFGPFFEAVWGYEPFPWQEELLARLVADRKDEQDQAGGWPEILDLPTGSGKTAAIDVALFHLALEAAKGSARRAPVRIAFVVDRRLIVDDAYGRTLRLRDALAWARMNEQDAKSAEAGLSDRSDAFHRVRRQPIVRTVARQLAHLAGAGQPPLVVRRMRGGVPREDDWARTPVQPTVLCSTVDQVGSRLLFRGYGVRDTMKPVQAGLLGSDCLILLDEAHLAEPFRQTLEAVQRLRVLDPAPFAVAQLTATRRQDGQAFTLSAADRAHPVLSMRLRASKPARLIEVAGKQGVDTESRRVEALASEAVTTLKTLKSSGIRHPAVGIVVNRVGRARAVFDRLRAELDTDARISLLIGPARAIDRDRHADDLAPIRTKAERSRSLGETTIIVATQTIEAGVDIDFDGLVTEAASIDALRQRFGRLNRAGRDIVPDAAVLAHKEDIGPKSDDPVYGDRIARTWKALEGWTGDDGRIDFGIDALATRLASGDVSALVAEAPAAPVLLPAYARLWSQTSPIPNADPEVALFLHGPDRAPASVQLVWRADIRPDDLKPDNRERLTELFTLMPPRAAEAIEVPLWAARAWLERAAARADDVADAPERPAGAEPSGERPRGAFRWAGSECNATGAIYPSELRPGDLVVVPAVYGGCDDWGWNPSSPEPVVDRSDAAQEPFRASRFAVRLAPELMADGGIDDREPPDPASLSDLLADHKDDRAPALLDAVLDSARALGLPDRVQEALGLLKRLCRGQPERAWTYGDDTERRPRGVVLVARRGLEVEKVEEEDEAAPPATEDDELSPLSVAPEPLIDHSLNVRSWTESFGEAAGLSAQLAADINLAAYFHDAGKGDPRFQAYFLGGNPYGPDAEHVLAKSGQKKLPREAWRRAGLPDHWRHEALSVQLVQLHPDFARANDPELVLWLIGTHHGHGRPLFPHRDPKDTERRPGLLKAYDLDGDLTPAPGPQTLAFSFNGVDWAQMFERLKERYGIWGLARLESFVRLADHRASQYGARNRGEPLREAAE
ncbi:MAG: hypothetical protein BroJett024_19030 [Alphaproteobacteria bacterium]|nr:MAG: hypothetical protein BroJett024_19030 [Alphaproteobacteria bacterium]